MGVDIGKIKKVSSGFDKEKREINAITLILERTFGRLMAGLQFCEGFIIYLLLCKTRN